MGATLAALFSGMVGCAPQVWQGRSEALWYAQFDGLPDCPCSLETFDPGSAAEPRDPGGSWTVPAEANQYHPGAALEIRWLRPNGGNGQQCTFDGQGRLINVGADAGTPDIVGPTNFATTFEHWRQDVIPFENNSLADYLRYWPPNRGEDTSGRPCPLNPERATRP